MLDLIVKEIASKNPRHRSSQKLCPLETKKQTSECKKNTTVVKSQMLSKNAFQDQRQSFRFRLPWLPAAPAPLPRPQIPAAGSQPPPQPSAPTPVAQRPPFRPPGLAPAQPLPQAQAPQRIESQPASPSRAATQTRAATLPPSPSRAATQSRAASQPPSPARAATQSQAATQPSSPAGAATQTRAASQPPSPSRAATQSQAATQPRSPSLAATQSQDATQPPSPSIVRTLQNQAAPQPLSPFRTASETQPASQAAPQPQSPPRLASSPAAQTSLLPPSPSVITPQAQLATAAVIQPPLPSEKKEPTTQKGSQPPSGSTVPLQSLSQEEPKPAGSQPESQEPQSKVENTSEAIIASTTSTAVVETSAPIQIPDSSLVSAAPKSLQESDGNPSGTIERKETVQELNNKQEINGVTVEPQQRTITELPTAASVSEVPNKKHPSDAFAIEQTKTVIPPPRDKNAASKSRQKSAISEDIRDDVSNFVQKLASQQPKLSMDEKQVSVITLAGENRGASMQLGSESARREGAVHIHRGYKIDPDESTEDREGNLEGRRSKDSKTEEDQASKAYVNSNVQCINNSIMFNSSITERNPGVGLVVLCNSTEPVRQTRRTESHETHKSEFNVIPAQKLTYEPTVRRRCLRGLLMESSDSDSDNPAKPRRHGCRFGCKEKSKDNEIDVI